MGTLQIKDKKNEFLRHALKGMYGDLKRSEETTSGLKTALEISVLCNEADQDMIKKLQEELLIWRMRSGG